MEHHILFAFVSPVREGAAPVHYADLAGAPYDAIQTNESAIVCKERELQADGNALERIFLLVSHDVKTGIAPSAAHGTGVTHIEFLEQQLLKACPELRGRITSLDYESDARELERGMQSIAGLADTVRTYVAGHLPGGAPTDDEYYTVHADMTGGYRHTTIMMVSILQMLSFYGIRQGDTLYSDPFARRVYHATPILQLTKLLSGMDEFVRYGSVDTLEDYFDQRESSDELADLLVAMHTFSDAIRVCATGQIVDTVKTLGERLRAFHELKNKNIEEELFDKCTDILKEDYDSLLAANVSRLDIIDWCGKHHFWQQQLTLSTEWLPEYFVDQRFAYAEDPLVIRCCEQEAKSYHSTWKKTFITGYGKNPKYRAPKEQLTAKGDASLIKPARRRLLEQIETGGCRDRLAEYLKYCQTGEMQTKLPYPEFIDVLQVYFSIREFRNTMNHARADDMKTTPKKMSREIHAYLARLRTYETR